MTSLFVKLFNKGSPMVPRVPSTGVLCTPQAVTRRLPHSCNLRTTSKRRYSSFKKRYRDLVEKHGEPPTLTKEYLIYLAGFIEGEGSFTSNITYSPRAKVAVKVDCIFNITQHVDGIVHLIAMMKHFRSGTILLKSGSNNTYVYSLQNKQALQEHVVPYYKKYGLKFTCAEKANTFVAWRKVLDCLIKKAHLTYTGLTTEIIPNVYKLNPKKGKIKKLSYENIQIYLKLFHDGKVNEAVTFLEANKTR
uniref:Putative LAGLIDADG homing endonuclease n=1 Tax=Neodangemannia microcystis TaxID=173495 RepID=A0A1W6EHC6_9CHLO|nr:putative LAGLIDADG homing endonuclease [Neodangemannia microcystis]YP_009367834.1 putative LAGLIDADG homing endonuclease [Neodangemannia microcystis]ARK14805.1 putative LAGLIDADG homing endonuclease [Neodangemannia microcystis]ARK14809.1 putative LAGLIDADG homing endonuclease [Neodangemannia microcystis]